MLGEIPFCLKTGKPASLGAKLRLIRQMYACQTSRGGKKSHERISTQMGRRELTCRKPCGVTALQCPPHLIWQQGLRGPALQPSQQVQRQMWLCWLCAGSPGAQPATLQVVSQKKMQKLTVLLVYAQ